MKRPDPRKEPQKYNDYLKQLEKNRERYVKRILIHPRRCGKTINKEKENGKTDD